MDKKIFLNKTKKFLCSFTLTSGIIASNSLYNYFHIDDVYDNIESNTSRQLISDYHEYNMKNGIDLEDPITAYNTYIDYIASLYKDVLHLTDPNEIFMVYCYMKNNGYLSYNREFSYGFPSIDIYGKKGISVVLGSGVCEHETEMFNDILKRMGVDCYKIVCSIDEYDEIIKTNLNMENKNSELTCETISYYSNFSRLCELSISPIIEVVASHETPTHVFSAVKYENKVYYFDTTNMVKWDYVGGEKWRCLPIDIKLKQDIYASFTSTYTKMENDIGNLLDFACDDDLETCKNIYEQLYIGEYDMLFSEWNNFIPNEIFDSMKILEDFKKMRREMYD